MVGLYCVTNFPRIPFPGQISISIGHKKKMGGIWVAEVKHQPLKSEGCIRDFQNLEATKTLFLVEWTKCGISIQRNIIQQQREMSC